MNTIRAFVFLALSLPAPLATMTGCTADVSVEVPAVDAAQPTNRPAGAPCAFDAQCATHRCSADVDAGTCGECVTIEALGDACTGPHQGCSISAICKDGVCQSLRKLEGEACALGAKGDDLDECDVELYCAHVGDEIDSGMCVRRTPLGESCAEAYGSCRSGAVCNHAKVCAIPAPDSCDGTGGCDPLSYCGDDLVCHPGTLPQDAACGLVDGHFVENECGPGLVCGDLESPNGGSSDTTCVPLPGKGEPCVRERCAAGLFCFRPPNDTTHPYCDSPRGEGEACSNDFYLLVACAEGLECRANTCRIACR